MKCFNTTLKNFIFVLSILRNCGRAYFHQDESNNSFSVYGWYSKDLIKLWWESQRNECQTESKVNDGRTSADGQSEATKTFPMSPANGQLINILGYFKEVLLDEANKGRSNSIDTSPPANEPRSHNHFLQHHHSEQPQQSVTSKPFNLLEQLKLEQLQSIQGSERKPKKKKKRKPKDKKKKRKKKKQKHPTTLGQPAHVIFASKPTEKPHYPHYQATVTTKKPYHKIKYILRKNNILKKRKKEYFGHLGAVLYPFVKFLVFFTVLNPFTLGVFLFSLISPVVFGFLGFAALSFLVKPALHLFFDVKRHVGKINRKISREKRRRERLRHNRRPITIHKHYYQNRPVRAPPPQRKPREKFNPILPHVRSKIRHGAVAAAAFAPKFVRYEKINYE